MLGATLPPTGFLREKDVRTLIPMGRSTLWEKVKAGKFPKPVKLGPKITAWRVEDIKAYIEQTSFPAKELTAP